jgi:hypothetical protein
VPDSTTTATYVDDNHSKHGGDGATTKLSKFGTTGMMLVSE